MSTLRIRSGHAAFLLLAGALLWAVLFARDLDAVWRAPGPLAAEKLVYIAPGSGTKAIAAKLEAAGAIADPFRFSILARLSHVHGDLKAGEYRLTPGISVVGIISLLQSGKTHQRMVTIAEGLTSSEITDIVNQTEALTGAAAPLPEGALLPETYGYSYNDAREKLIMRMREAMQDTLQQAWRTRADGLPLKTPEEAVILASIVEKETALPAERPRIARVFYNRLKAGMPLQSDPTVIYALTKGKGKLDRALLRKDLSFPSPYNTYYASGLPPGPIANPGRAALEAVLHPEENDYLYFVADGSGGHAFARTLSEHERNVGKWHTVRKNEH